jgi:hypothetical protein
MNHQHFQYSPNILMPYWPTIRMANREKYIVGATMLITYGKQRKEIGEARIVHVSNVQYKAITNEIAFMVSGKPAPYVKGILAKIYPNVQADSVMSVVVYEWVQRYLAEQQDMVKQWWESQVAQTPNYSDFKMRIAS